MKKQDKIQDSPEFQYYKDNFENFVKGMEEDKESADLKIPDGWEQDFEKTIGDTLDKNEWKRKTRIVKRIVGVAAAVVLVVAVGSFTAVSVSGEGLLEMFINQFMVGDKQHDIFGTNNEIEFDEDNNENKIYFNGITLDEVYNQIQKELKCPMFYLGYVPDGFTVEEATYEKSYRVINISLLNENGEHIYIFQQKQVDDTASGTMAENTVESDQECLAISNIELDKEIYIFESLQDYSLVFNVKEKNDLLTIYTSISKEECIKIAENLEFH